MTRKRFIKLCMGYEVQRNEAETITKIVGDYGSYEQLWTEYATIFKQMYIAQKLMREWH